MTDVSQKLRHAASGVLDGRQTHWRRCRTNKSHQSQSFLLCVWLVSVLSHHASLRSEHEPFPKWRLSLGVCVIKRNLWNPNAISPSHQGGEVEVLLDKNTQRPKYNLCFSPDSSRQAGSHLYHICSWDDVLQGTRCSAATSQNKNRLFPKDLECQHLTGGEDSSED